MRHLKTILVGLDATAIDEYLIKYISMFAELSECTKVHFVHITKKNSVSIKQFFEEKVSMHFKTTACQSEVQIIPGSNATKIIHWSNLSNLDLIVLGIKPKRESSGKHAAKVINLAKCSVLLMPRATKLKFNKVILPLNFTGSSLPALDFAIGMKEKIGVEIFLHHVYFVPSGYTQTGKSYDEMANIMLKNKQQEYKQFKHRYNLDESKYEVIFELDEDQNPSDNICEMAKKLNVDLILVASRGRTKLAAMLKHTTAVSMINYDRDLACLVVKKKTYNMGFFEALMQI